MMTKQRKDAIQAAERVFTRAQVLELLGRFMAEREQAAKLGKFKITLSMGPEGQWRQPKWGVERDFPIE